jgi:hypothetical protein
MKETDRRVELPLQTRLAPIAGVDAKARVANLVWSTGAGVWRQDFWTGEQFFEELSMDPAHIRLQRLNSGAPLLNTHKRLDLQGVIGVVEKATVSDGEGRAAVRFSERADVQPIFNDVATGIIRNVSVGYIVHKYERSQNDAGALVMRAVDWEPSELSLVPIGADPGAGVRSGSQETYPCVITYPQIQTREATMENNTETTKPSATELARVRSIHQLCQHNKLPESFELRLIGDGATVAEARAQILDELAKRSATSINGAHLADLRPSGSGGQESNREVQLMAEALHARFGGPAPSEEARQFYGMRVTDIARWALERRGISTRGMTAGQIITRTYGSTSDFPEVLGSTMNRELRRRYDSYTGGLRNACRKSTTPDFRSKYKVNLGEAPALAKILPGGEYKRGKMLEARESYKADTYGAMFGINRQALINDDLGAFVDIAAKYGQQAAEMESGVLVALLTSNPTMNVDSTALFHANHKNLSASNDAISVASLGAAKEAMRLQTGLDGKTAINVTPRFLIVPAKKETLALQYLAQLYPSQSSNVNPFAGILELIVEPRLDAASTTAWYLAADPNQIDTIEYAYLEGQEGVYLETRLGWDIDGIEFKVRDDFGAGLVDFRGLYKNAGA